MVKEAFQRGEDAAFWMRQKTRELITATNLDQPLKQADSMAAKSFDEVERRTRKVNSYTYLLFKPLSSRMTRIFSDWIFILRFSCCSRRSQLLLMF